MLDKVAVPYQIVLTKADKVKAGALSACIADITGKLKKRAAAIPEILVTSSRTGNGVADDIGTGTWTTAVKFSARNGLRKPIS